MGQAKIKRAKTVEVQEVSHSSAEVAGAVALEAIRARSFSGRHQDLGKMIKCQVCGHRHRESVVHKQVFAKRWIVVDGKKVYTDEQLIAGKTSETESVIESRRIRLTVGAAGFKGKRRFPPLNKRANEFVQLVYDLLPDEYTPELLEAARKRAKRFLAKKYGRFGFLPPVWQKQKEEHEHQESDSHVDVPSGEAEISPA